MATKTILLTDTWHQLTVTGTHLLVQASDVASLHIGTTTPAVSDNGHTLRNNMLFNVDNFAALGGDAWVRGSGTFTYSA